MKKGRVLVSVARDEGGKPSLRAVTQGTQVSTKKVCRLPHGLPICVAVTDVIDHPEASIWKPAKHVVKPGRIRIFIRWFATLHTMDYRPGPISARVTLRDLAEGDYEVCLGDGPAVGTIRITGRSSGKSSNRLTGD